MLSLRAHRRAKTTSRSPSSLWSTEDIGFWQTRLGYLTPQVAQKTLHVTTQLMESEENLASYTIMKDHFKKRFPGLGCYRVKDMAYCDLVQPSVKSGLSKRGFKYSLLIALKKSKTVHSYLLKSKDDASEALSRYFREVCLPNKIVTDGAGELTGEA